jgi:hypothetical protein
MHASARSLFLLFFFLFAISLAGIVPVYAQTNGVPPSVTSMGFGGRFINGVPPSVTSFGPDGYGKNWSVLGDCCANLFWPANPNSSLNSGHHHHHKKGDAALAGVVEPVSIPYAAADAPEDDDDSGDGVPAAAADPGNLDPAIGHAQDSGDRSLAGARPDPVALTAPVVAQPSTVLIFKDGHRSDVLNYAIAGDTLFDFSAGRTHKIPLSDLDLPATHKANDDRGVDFQIPDGTGQ